MTVGDSSMKKSSFHAGLSESEILQIETAIAEIEKKTDAEVVVCLARKSSWAYLYKHLMVLLLLLAWVPGYLMVYVNHYMDADQAWQVPMTSVDWFLMLVCPVLILIMFVLVKASHKKALKIRDWVYKLLNFGFIERSVFIKASEVFTAHGMTKTERRTGVLVYLSFKERSSVILADSKILAIFPNSYWKAHLLELKKYIQTDHLAEGLTQLLTRMGQDLSQKFPPESRNADELPNQLIFKD